jgi:hypothetical protein
LKAGAHDRINVQNNPVNLIDPYGLQTGAGAGAGMGPLGLIGAHPVFQPGNPINDIIVNDIKNWFSPENVAIRLKIGLMIANPNIAWLMARPGRQVDSRIEKLVGETISAIILAGGKRPDRCAVLEMLI